MSFAAPVLTLLLLGQPAVDDDPKVNDPRLQLQLFAAAPDIVTPVGIAVDDKGRVLCIESNTHFPPADYQGHKTDRIRMFEDTNGDGKADKCITFYDKLHCPVGFEFWNGGVLVVDQPRIIFLKDTNGDDKADVVE